MMVDTTAKRWRWWKVGSGGGGGRGTNGHVSVTILQTVDVTTWVAAYMTVSHVTSPRRLNKMLNPCLARTYIYLYLNTTKLIVIQLLSLFNSSYFRFFGLLIINNNKYYRQ